MEQALQSSQSPIPGAAESERTAADVVELRHTRHAKVWVLALYGLTLLVAVLNSLWMALADSVWLSCGFIGLYALESFIACKEINLQMVRADAAGLTVRALWSGVQRVQWDEIASFSLEADARGKTSVSSCVVTMRTRGILKDLRGSTLMNMLPTGRGHHILKLKLALGSEDERLRLREFIEGRLQEHGARKDFSRHGNDTLPIAEGI